MKLDTAEKAVRVAGTVGVLVFLAMVYQGLWRASRHAKGRTAGEVSPVQRAPVWLAIPLGTAFSAVVFRWLWRPLKPALPALARLVTTVTGALLFFSGLGLMLWGRRTLADMYNLSTSLGAELYADHRLVTSGPYGIVRHPMYVGGIMFELGALLIYRTGATLVLALNIPALVLRARREEQALAAEFGEQFTAYKRRVPGFLPRIGSQRGG